MLVLDSFRKLVAGTWCKSFIKGTISFRIATKLKLLKAEIKSWAKETGRKEEEGISDILIEIDDLDRKEENLLLFTEDREKKNMKLMLSNKLHMEAISWKQIVRKKWIKDGDRYSKYFHMLANHRRRINYVEELTIGNNKIKENEAFRKGAKDHFQNLYSE